MERTQNTPFSSVAGRENTQVPGSGGGDATSEQVECLGRAPKYVQEEGSDTVIVLMFYISVSISPTANRRKGGEEAA